jgi:hypothetical protein
MSNRPRANNKLSAISYQPSAITSSLKTDS